MAARSDISAQVGLVAARSDVSAQVGLVAAGCSQ